MKSRGIRVTVCDARGRRTQVPGLSRWLEKVAPSRARGEVSVAIVSDARIRALNRRYRGKNATTDVLSFSYTPDLKVGPAVGPTRSGCLGDIVIARGVARRQARTAGHDERTELRVLALHGLLHLLGFDHHHDNGDMARTERRLLRKGGLSQGLIDRTEPS